MNLSVAGVFMKRSMLFQERWLDGLAAMFKMLLKSKLYITNNRFKTIFKSYIHMYVYIFFFQMFVDTDNIHIKYIHIYKELGSLTTKFGPISEIDEKPNRDEY